MARIIELFPAVMCLLMLIGGFWITGIAIIHIEEGESSHDAKVSIAHLGEVSGSQHLIALAVGAALVYGGVHMGTKIYRGFTDKGVRMKKAAPRWSSRITESGRTIAALINKNKPDGGGT